MHTGIHRLLNIFFKIKGRETYYLIKLLTLTVKSDIYFFFFSFTFFFFYKNEFVSKTLRKSTKNLEPVGSIANLVSSLASNNM
jgi:hypothetical protein